MTDVFISYSRRDKVFTQKLVDALASANREVWADWASIPAASDWDAEIKEGIEKTNTVLFVLSPEWIKSNECRKEMVHALQMGKRLVPILYIMPAEGQEVPPELAKLNWVYMRETDDFDKAFEILQGAMDTDLDWVKVHTRIQVRAIEWDKKNRDNSFTLRGKDLIDGEQFISGATGKSPEPTQLQGEYVIASRKDATRRQRITMTGITVALVVSIALGIMAYFQRQAAVLNSKISFARELTAASETSIEEDPERSLLLVLQAIQITTDAGQEILPSEEDALRNAIQSSRVRHTVIIPNESVTAVAFSPDGRFAAAGTAGGKLFVWKIFNIAEPPPNAGENIGSIWLEEVFTIPESGQVIQSIAFSFDGTLIATSTDETGRPAIWETQTGKRRINLPRKIGFINQIAFSPNENYLATGGDDGTVRVWDPRTGDQISLNADHASRVTGIAFSPDGTTIASTGESGRVILSETKNGAASYSSDAEPVPPTVLAFSPRGDLVAFGNWGYNLKILDLNTKVILNTKLHKESISGIAFSPDGSLVISTGLDGKGIAIDPNTGRRVFVLSDGVNDMLAVAFSPDGKYVATGNEAGEFKIWDASIIPPAEAGIVVSQNQPATGLGFLDNGKRIITSGDEPKAQLYDLENQSSITLYNSPSWINDVAVSPDQKYVAMSDETGVISIWDANNGRKVTEFSENEASVFDIEFSPDGSRLTSTGDFAYIWELPGGTLSFKFDTGNWNWSSTFSPDGKKLAVGNDAGTLTMFDIGSGKKLWEANEHTGNIRSIAFTLDGTSLVSGGFDGKAFLWDTNSGKELHRFSGHLAGITNVAISPDGKQLATSSADSTTKVWDLNEGSLLYTLSANKFYDYFWVNNVAYSPDGNLLATGSEDGTMRFYFTSMEDVLVLARSRITRSLTDEECKTYLHMDTCPDDLIQPEKPAGKPDSMEALAPLPPVEVTFSNPDLKSIGSQTKINLDVRNKTTSGVTLFEVDENGNELLLGTIAPSEVLRFYSLGSIAFRIKDSQNYPIMEYLSTNDPYQQINIRSISHMPVRQPTASSTIYPTTRVNYKNEDGSKTGYFISNELGVWIEENSDGTFSFTEVDHTGDIITLEKSDGALIVINLEENIISLKVPDTDYEINPLYLITSVGDN